MRTLALVVVTVVGLAGCGSRADVEVAASSPSSPTATTAPTPAATPSAETSPSPVPSPTTAAAEATEEVLSPCRTAAGDVTTRTVLDGSGPRPGDDVIDAALADWPDLQELVRSLEYEGVSTADARHAAYAQVLSEPFFSYSQSFDGYVEGRVAGFPEPGDPFGVTFAGTVPEDFDPAGFGLDSYGLEVTAGVAGSYEEVFDEAFQRDVFDAVETAGLVVKDLTDDVTTGTLRISVVEATPAQVAAFEAELDEPDRVCLVRVPPELPCDDTVVAAAQDEARRQGEVVTGSTSDVADDVRRSHLGLTLDVSRAKAEQEGRAWRISAQDGVSLALTADAQAGRLNVTVCRGVVVDAGMESFE